MNLIQLIQSTIPENYEWLTPQQNPLIQWVSSNLSETQPSDLLLISSQAEWDDLLNQKNPALQPGAVLWTAPHLSFPEKGTIPFPVLSLKKALPLRKIHQELTKKLLDLSSTQLERRLAIQEQLSKQTAEGEDVQALARTMQTISGHAVLIQDKRLDAIAAYPTPGMLDVWLDIVASLSDSNSLPLPLQNRKQAGELQSPLLQELSGGLARLVIPIIVGQVARGYLSIINLRDSLDTIDQITAEEGARFCAIKMSHTKAIRETEKKLQSNLLNALLHGILSSRDAELWFQAVGLDENQAHIPLQFAWDSDNPPSRRRLETIINGIIQKRNLVVILNPTGDKVICFFQIPRENKLAYGPIELAKEVLQQAQEEYPHSAVRCGIGTAAYDTNSWSHSFKESGFALELAFRLKHNQPFYYPDLSIYRLLMLLENNPELETFQRDMLGELLEQDNKQVLLETLEAYYQNGGNLSQTAETLFIHRNTLSYRLDRIREICSLDLNHPDTSLAMQIALRLYRMGKTG
ncbi:MAG: hypothetical protein CL609_18625 [Anaerolineaceae bacterium]|nr:hypothetical protein [Anaerolineaceae bacterium]